MIEIPDLKTLMHAQKDVLNVWLITRLNMMMARINVPGKSLLKIVAI